MTRRKRPPQPATPKPPPITSREQWLAENRDAIAAYNRHVEVYGLWSDGRRRF